MSGPVNDDWVQCPPGELNRLAVRLRGRRHRRVLMQATAAVAVLAVAVGGWLLWPSPKPTGEYNFAGITCSRVLELADAYAAGKLSHELRAQVREHVAQCPHCGPKFKEMGMTVKVQHAVPPWATESDGQHVLLASAIP